MKSNKKIAIIGFSFRFPSTNRDQFWGDLLAGNDLVSEVAATRWALDTYRHPNKNHPGTSYTFAAGSIGDASQFDANFFGISPREAALMDPQQRLLLEMSWEALENSGIKPSSLSGTSCGVYIGISSNDYAYRLADDLSAIDSTTATGNTSSIAANRISYVLDLHGPSMAIDTACSSSLVAFHQACQSIQTGECTTALTGGVSLHLHPYGFITFSKASMLSRKGHCQVFDAQGDGYVRSEGGGIFLLKDYDQALADGNPILALVAGSGVNTDGRKSGLTVPNIKAQVDLLTHTYAKAGIDPAAIDYLEAHGTGTVVGDPIEASAIGLALGQRRIFPLPIGSVKSNLGHMEAASGVAGLVKALHCLQHRTVTATIGIKTLNPRIDFTALNITVPTENLPLKKSGKLIVGVNSFGFGGANAHIILESFEQSRSHLASFSDRTDLPILLSAKTPEALQQAAHDFAQFLAKQPESARYDISYNTIYHREWHPCRLLVTEPTQASLIQALSTFNGDSNDQIACGVALTAPQGPVFIYSGNGSQWAGMGQQLLQESPVFLATIRELDALFRPYSTISLEEELSLDSDDRYEFTEIAQPTLFALQVGVTRLLADWGVTPALVAGHSVGEVAAAWASGALSLPDAVAVIYHRSQTQGTTKGCGQMTAVACGQVKAEALLDTIQEGSLTLAGINSSHGVTVAGDSSTLALLEQKLSEQGIQYKRLPLDYAFHSPAMDPIETAIKQSLSTIKPSPTSIPFYSTVTGELLEGQQLDAEYWWQNIRKPVLFEQAIQSLLLTGHRIFIEIGPHGVLRGYLNSALKDAKAEGKVITTLNRHEGSVERVRTAWKQSIIAGININWTKFFTKPASVISLPNYPWQRERHWHPTSPDSLGLLTRRRVHPLLGYPLAQQELTWENQLDILTLPSLAHHVVGEDIIFPGTGFVELALAAALAWKPDQWVALEELEIRSPLIFSSEHSSTLRVYLLPTDGSLTMSTRNQLGTEPWSIRATARLLSQPQPFSQSAPSFPERQPDFTGESHNALTQMVGLHYGEQFRRIDHGWVEGDSALALFTAEAMGADLSHTHLNPAILDCAFQLIIQLLREDLSLHEGMAFVPVKIGHIVFHNTNTAPYCAQATLRKRSPHSLVADFTLFDSSNQLIAVVQEARFRRVRLSKNPADHLRYLDFHATPAPHPLTPIRASVSFNQMQEALTHVIQESQEKKIFNTYTDEVEPLLDSLCSNYTHQALRQLADATGLLTLDAIEKYQRQAPQITHYFNKLLQQAEQDQLIVPQPDGWKIVHEQNLTPQDIWAILLGDYPKYFQILLSVGRAGLHLPGILAGEFDPVKLLTESSSPSTLMRLALGEAGSNHLTTTVRDWVNYSLQQLPQGQRLGILEISSGLPVFAADICAQLDFNCCEFAFSSLSDKALQEATTLQELYPRMRVTPIGSTSPAFSQLAIVQLDFPTQHEAMRVLRYAKSQLISEGCLLLIGQHPSRWMNFVLDYGQTEQDAGWYMTPPQGWQQQLYELGFISSPHQDFVAKARSGPYVLLAQNCAHPIPEIQSDPPRYWLLLADEVGYSATLAPLLAKKLAERGERTMICPLDSVATLLHNTSISFDGIVLLSGMNAPLHGAEDILQQQVARCASAALISQACEATQAKLTCWFITARVTLDLLSPSHDVASLPDAALWGFARTLINEASSYNVRLIDVHDPEKMDTLVEALDHELTLIDPENEIIISSNGTRYATRLRDEPRPEINESLIETPTLGLKFSTAGQLRHLRWEAYPRVIPNENEIEVEVQATGLNFRDVMYALGLLSDEAIENGFAGSTLGLEFAGVVLNVGKNIRNFAVGDSVMGFGPASFSNRVITKPNALSLIPKNMPFAAAATLPSTFLTVYYGLHHLAQLQPGEKILIHGAAGGIGIAAIQLAQWIGAEIHATAGSDEKRDFLRLLGVHHIYDSRSLAFADEILAKTGGVDVVLNSLAGEAINRNFQVLKPFGRFIELGKRDFYENTKIGLRPFRNNISYFGVDADQLMQIRPDLTLRLFTEVMHLFHEGALHPLPYTVFEANDIVSAFRYMQQAKQIGKIVVTYHQPVHRVHRANQLNTKALTLNPEATYLVTGGLSGFGLKTAQWLATKGARHLVLISRSGPKSEEAKHAIATLKDHGVHIYAVACDVTDQEALSNLLQHIHQTMPPLKGIVHAAMVISDGLIQNMDAAQIERVLAPKVLGALHLHQLTLALPLDYFILFSSATTLFGNPGQGNYVAANTALEALARNRRAMGLTATCVRWGAIEDVGFLARHSAIKEALQNRMGGRALKSDVALATLESILLANRSGLAVLELDWNALTRFMPGAQSAKYSELAQYQGNEETHGEEDFQRLLDELSLDELLITITQMIKQEVGEILRVMPDKIDAHRSIYDMGLDSLMGVELVLALESRFGIRLSVMMLSTTPSIAKLAERLLAQLKGAENNEAQQHIEQVATQHGVEMTAESIHTLAREIQETKVQQRMIN
jgi:acyl transferase domain-containing protein/NADPH:quinone reductase-like Zn-dependent oxidoreductase/acyl carrier protein